MFTGIITGTTAVVKARPDKGGLLLTFKKPRTWTDLVVGESVATDGACLTVAAVRADEYDCFLMPETLTKTAFGKKVPKAVNMERALQLNDRLGGHFVQGHVDAMGAVTAIDTTNGYRFRVQFPAQFQPLVIYKGSIAINGVSLTVATIQDNELSVALIPLTLQQTTLGSLKVGDRVNLEFDMLGKYVANMLEKK